MDQKSKIPGVFWDKSRNRWRVYIELNGKRKFIATTPNLKDAESLRKDAEEGIFTTDDQKREIIYDKMARIRTRAVWREIIKTDHGWNSFDHFLSTVGNRPNAVNKLVAEDSSKIIGPDNFKWIKPEFDFTTKEGRNAYTRDHRAKNPDIYRDREFKKNF